MPAKMKRLQSLTTALASVDGDLWCVQRHSIAVRRDQDLAAVGEVDTRSGGIVNSVASLDEGSVVVATERGIQIVDKKTRKWETKQFVTHKKMQNHSVIT